MIIETRCNKCGKQLKAPETLAGKKCRCRSCGSIMTVPALRADLLTADDVVEEPLQRESSSRQPAAAASRGEDLTEYCDIFKILSDETRLRLLILLEDGPHSVSELVSATGQSQPTVSHHLGLLRSCRLVTTQRAGKSVIYQLKRDQIQKLGGLIKRLS